MTKTIKSRPLPQRITLADQAASILRENIRLAVWHQELPPEPALARELKVGRNTVRAAVNQLIREGVVTAGGPGRRHGIADRPGKARRPAVGRTIRYLSPLPLKAIDLVTQIILNGLQDRLSAEGYHFEFESHPSLFRRFTARRLEKLLEQPDTAGWILLWASLEIQKWFADRKLPCIVTGSVHPGVSLPNVEFDFRAVCRHAVGRFVSRGHECIALLSRKTSNASELASEAAFLEAAQASRRPVHARVIVCDHTRAAICQALDRLIGAASRPTGLLVSLPEQVLTVTGHLQRRGLRIPQDMAVISRVSDSYMDFLVPAVARYRLDTERFSRESANLILRVVKHGAGHVSSLKIMPEFVPGESL
jgi:DNA-binding LacI/PurR family transcriptional regulator